MRIGIAYDRVEEYAGVEGPADRFAEFEPESTIAVMEAALRHAGHEPVRLGGPHAIRRDGFRNVDAVWNIAEGYGSRNREAWVPVLCELAGVRCLGSDAHTLSVSLDKRLSKQVAAAGGIPVAEEGVLTPARPVLVKPRYEGTAKGLGASAIVRSPAELEAARARCRREYGQEPLVEAFLPGAEFTVALSGVPLRAHPVLERALDPVTRLGSHVTGSGDESLLTHALTPELERRLRDWSVALCAELGVRHWARLDYKCDAAGNPYFLEINPLPTFAVDGTFAIVAELEGKGYVEFLAGVVGEGVRDKG